MRTLQAYVPVSLWLLTTLVPNVIMAWKRGGWYWRTSGHYAGRLWAAAIWLLWILLANYLIYPTVERATMWVYSSVGEAYAGPTFLITMTLWVYFFIWKGEKRGEV